MTKLHLNCKSLAQTLLSVYIKFKIWISDYLCSYPLHVSNLITPYICAFHLDFFFCFIDFGLLYSELYFHQLFHSQYLFFSPNYFYQLEVNYFAILQWFLPYIDMNQPWIYMCSPSRSPLPPPSPSHPSGSSQCTSPEHLSHASSLGW